MSSSITSSFSTTFSVLSAFSDSLLFCSDVVVIADVADVANVADVADVADVAVVADVADVADIVVVVVFVVVNSVTSEVEDGLSFDPNLARN